MDTRTPLYIDLKRSLDFPHGSLSPHSPSGAKSSGRGSEPESRRQQRQDAEEFTGSALYLFLGFIVLTLAIYHHHNALLPLLGF